jgi:hypothetical protein
MNQRSLILHQTLHGYMRGHELLSSSTDLNTADLDRMVQLSDLSGYPVASSFPPYLTCYSLPSLEYYAFACTWLDNDAPRDGCVLTHTILIPMKEWKNADISAQKIYELFRQPNRLNFSEYSFEIDVLRESDELRRERKPDICRVVSNYFVNGEPLVVLNLDSSVGNKILPAFLDLLWPSLRGQFTGCTYSLQPRQIERRQFDIQFAPADALSKFSRIPESQLIRRLDEPSKKEDARVDRLVELVNREWTGEGSLNEFFGDDLWRELPANPTALYKLVIFDDLNKRSEETPSSSIAALDVLGGVFPDSNAAIDAKERALRRAIEHAILQPLSNKLEYFASIALRCSKSSFGKLRKLRRDLVDEISRLSIDAPASALEAMSRSKGRNAPLFTGIGKAVPAWSVHYHELLGEFGDYYPAQIESLLRYAPEVAPAHLKAMAGSRGGIERGIINVLNWYGKSRAYVRSLIGKRITETEIFTYHEALVDIAVEHAGAKQLHLIYSAFLIDPHKVCQFDHALQWLVNKFPVESRRSILEIGIQTDLAADLFVATLADSSDGFQIIESLYSQSVIGFVKASAAFVRHSPSSRVAGLAFAGKSESWLQLWLDGDVPPSKPMISASRILLDQFDNLDISLRLSPKKRYHFEADESFAEIFGDAILRSIVHTYLINNMSEDTLIDWLRNVLISQRIQKSEYFGLNETQTKNISYSNGTKLWKYVRLIGEEVEVSQRKLEWMCTGLFESYKSTWNQQMTDEWRQILQIVQKPSRPLSRIEAAALNIALENPNLPLVEIVDQTFVRVYRATAPRASQTFFEIMWTNAFESGVGLRKRLLTAFRESDWPPEKLGDIALDAGIAEEIFRDLHSIDSAYFNFVYKELTHAWANQPKLHKILKVFEKINR